MTRRELLRRYGTAFGWAILLGGSADLLAGSGLIPEARRAGVGTPVPAPVLRASDFGCDPTGTRTCTQQLAELLSAAAGGTARLDPGTYVFDAPLRLPNRTVLDGPGTLKVADHANIPSSMGALTVGTDSTVRRVTLDGNKVMQSGEPAGIFARHEHRVRVSSATIRDTPGRSVFLDGCPASVVEGCTIENTGSTAAADGSRAGISVPNSSHTWVVNNWVKGSAGEGIVIVADGAVVSGNRIQDPHSIGIATGGGQHSDIVITRNSVQVSRTWTNTADGLLWPNCIDVGNSRDCVVSGNQTFGGVVGLANAPPSYGTVARGNVFQYARKYGLSLGGAAGGEPVRPLVMDNRCVGNGWDGIALSWVVDSWVYGNICLDNGAESRHGAGISLYGDPSRGYARGVLISGNRCGNNGSLRTQRYGVRISGIGNKDIRLVRNGLGGNALADIFDGAAPGSVKHR